MLIYVKLDFELYYLIINLTQQSIIYVRSVIRIPPPKKKLEMFGETNKKEISFNFVN